MKKVYGSVVMMFAISLLFVASAFARGNPYVGGYGFTHGNPMVGGYPFTRGNPYVGGYLPQYKTETSNNVFVQSQFL